MGVKLRVNGGLPGMGGELVELAPGVWVSKWMSASATWNGQCDPAELPYDVDLEVEFEDGRFICVALRCGRRKGGPPVTNELIRHIPVVGLTRMLAHGHVVAVEHPTKGTTKVSPYNWDAAADDAAAEGPTDKTLQAVAVAYRFAYACWWPPTQFVATQFQLPRSTAAKWVTLARRAGYLAETRERKAGG